MKVLLFLSLFAFFPPLSSYAQTQNTSQYKLVVLIAIDQMRADYLFRFREVFSEEGFLHFIHQGQFYEDVRNENIIKERTPSMATLMTGSYPSLHGLPSDSWYHPSLGGLVSGIGDGGSVTLGSPLSIGYSAKNLRIRTLGDWLKQFYGNRSIVVAAAPRPEMVIPAAGHRADAAYWYDEKYGKIVGSSYYRNDIPAYMDTFNSHFLPAETYYPTWELCLPEGAYSKTPVDGRILEQGFPLNGNTFPYSTLRLKEQFGNKWLLYTPFINDIMTELSLRLAKEYRLGRGSRTDMMVVGYSSMDDASMFFGPHSREMEDVYARLDKNIARLRTYLNKHVGEKNILYVLTSPRSDSPSPEVYSNEMNIRSGYVNVLTLTALLRSYFYVLFGDRSITINNHGIQFFLKHFLDEKGKQSFVDLLNKGAELLEQGEGVGHCYVMHRSSVRDMPADVRNSWVPKRSGSLIIRPNNGWGLRSGDKSELYIHEQHLPTIFLTANKYGKNIPQRIELRDITPTILHLLNLPALPSSTGRVAIGIRR